MNQYKKLLAKYEIVAVQETHGSMDDLSTLHRECGSHFHLMSTIAGRNAGGMLISVGKKLIKNFCYGLLEVHIAPGRAHKVIITLKDFELVIINVHLNPSINPQEANEFMEKIKRASEHSSPACPSK